MNTTNLRKKSKTPMVATRLRIIHIIHTLFRLAIVATFPLASLEGGIIALLDHVFHPICDGTMIFWAFVFPFGLVVPLIGCSTNGFSNVTCNLPKPIPCLLLLAQFNYIQNTTSIYICILIPTWPKQLHISIEF